MLEQIKQVAHKQMGEYNIRKFAKIAKGFPFLQDVVAEAIAKHTVH